MNPNSPQTNFELPAPLSEQGGAQPHVEAHPLSPENNLQATPQVGQAAPGASTSTLPASPQPSSQTAQQAAQASLHSPQDASDDHLIEDEWILKAKQIMASTRDDPRAQSREFAKFKADYLKKRYNKDLKVEES